jgi:hypothetical protein
MARLVRVKGKSTSGTADGQTQHRDAVGHLDAGHQRRLLRLAMGHHNPDGDPESVRAFIAGRKTSDGIGEEMAEAFLASATSGEPCELDRLDQVTEDEAGGPFITTLAEEELAIGSEDSDGYEDTNGPSSRDWTPAQNR